jgi:hypothetical protein
MSSRSIARGGDELLVGIGDGLQPGNLPDRADGDAADLAHALGQLVRGLEDRFRPLVQHQVVVAEMPPADVPMEVLGLQV